MKVIQHGHRRDNAYSTIIEPVTLDEKFVDAQQRVKTLARAPGNDKLLELYALYKQATTGDVQGKRPGMFDLKGAAKYDAWARKRGLAADDAKGRYVALVDELVARGPTSG
jgi:acyl-CoA-binding protein